MLFTVRHSCVQLTLSNVFDKSRLTTHTQARQQLKTDQLQHSHSPSVLPTCTLGEIRVPLLIASCPKHSQCATNVLYSKRMLTIGLKSVGNFAFWALPNIETKRYAQHTVHTLLSKQHYITVCYIIDQASRRENRQEDIATFRLPNQTNVITTVVRLQTMDSTFQLAKGPRRFRRIIIFFWRQRNRKKKCSIIAKSSGAGCSK